MNGPMRRVIHDGMITLDLRPFLSPPKVETLLLCQREEVGMARKRYSDEDCLRILRQVDWIWWRVRIDLRPLN